MDSGKLGSLLYGREKKTNYNFVEVVLTRTWILWTTIKTILCADSQTYHAR